MKTRLITLVMSLIACIYPCFAIHSWELPKDTPPDTEEYWQFISQQEPDCSYSFLKDGIYYWISDEDAATVMVVNEHKFYARQYCYEVFTGIDHYVAGYENPYIQTEIEIPSSIEYEGKTYTVTEIGFNAFTGSHNLKKVILPSSINNLWIAAFGRCDRLTDIQLSPNVDYLDYSIFKGCSALLKIDLTYLKQGVYSPKNVFEVNKSTVLEEIILPVEVENGYEYLGIPSLRRLYLRNPEPPQFEMITFDDEVYEKATLYVPEGSVEKYKADQRWGRFANIMAESSGVEQLESAEATFTLKGSTLAAGAEDVTVYKADGRTVCALHAGEEADLATGLYIIRSSDKAQKVIVR